jgi:DNA modification methylase
VVEPDPSRRRPGGTSTSAFGVGRREGHDASAFYRRFEPPHLTDDDTVAPPAPVVEPFVCGDARRMDAVADNSVALVVTSPPYFAGKQYEEELGRDGVPASYLEYLALLRDVFADCVRALEPGGRLAVNVANLGRKPFRSLTADVTGILQDDLGLLLRGEVVWRKADGANGSCAWGSYRSPSNPVLRDTTERVVLASKGRFDRAVPARLRRQRGLPNQPTITGDEFLAATLDVWDIAPESARRVNHPAPFPVELPQRLIELYTWHDDLVLDPFMGSGSTLVAAARTGRRYVGYDLDPAYVALARDRVAAEGDGPPAPAEAPASARALAEAALTTAGFTVTGRDRRIRATGVTVDLVAEDTAGRTWYVAVPGGLTTTRTGLGRTDQVWGLLGRAHVLARHGHAPVLALTTDPPGRGSEGDTALRAAGPGTVHDVIDLRDPPALARLARYAVDGPNDGPRPGYWTDRDLRPR